MKKCYTLIACLGICWGIMALPLRQGFILTKNNYQLTGFIGDIYHNDRGSQVGFVNDFGTAYTFHPALIKGFAFRQDGQIHVYESKFWHRRWVFLRVVVEGEDMRLLQAPEIYTATWNGGHYAPINTTVIEEYWIEVPGRFLFPVRRLNFRKKLGRIIAEVSPELNARLGEPDYRYRNLPRIVEAYNEQCKKGKYRL